MKWRNEQLDDDMNIVRDVISAIRRVRSINNFNKDQSESNQKEFYNILNVIFKTLFSVILLSKCQKVLKKYEDIIQNLSGSTSLCFLEQNSNLKLNSIVDIVGDHTEIHLLLKVFYFYC